MSWKETNTISRTYTRKQQLQESIIVINLEILKNLGLTPNESLIYQTLLTGGTAEIIALQKETKIARTQIHVILDALEEK